MELGLDSIRSAGQGSGGIAAEGRLARTAARAAPNHDRTAAPAPLVALASLAPLRRAWRQGVALELTGD